MTAARASGVVTDGSGSAAWRTQVAVNERAWWLRRAWPVCVAGLVPCNLYRYDASAVDAAYDRYHADSDAQARQAAARTGDPDHPDHARRVVVRRNGLEVTEWQCSALGCDYTSPSKSAMDRHAVTHAQVQPLRCRYSGCDIRFTQTCSRNTHEATQHPEWHRDGCRDAGPASGVDTARATPRASTPTENGTA